MTAIQTEPFVPLTTATVPRSSASDQNHFSVTVISQAASVQSFKALELESPAAPAAPTVPHTKSCDPRVSIQREGDLVTGIRIQCSCGQVIDLACVY
jgi:hypothetical protein